MNRSSSQRAQASEVEMEIISRCSSEGVHDADDAATTLDQGDSVGGVEWLPARLKAHLSSDFIANFAGATRVTALSGRSKLLIASRFFPLFDKYRQKHVKFRALNTSMKIAISIGSLLVPALLSIDDDIRERSPASQAIFYVVFSLSLGVGIINAVLELLQISKRFYTYAATNKALEQEAWSFLLLRGGYKNHKRHSSCWQTFLYRVERIHQVASVQDLALYQKGDHGGGRVNIHETIRSRIGQDGVGDSSASGAGSDQPPGFEHESIQTPTARTQEEANRSLAEGVASQLRETPQFTIEVDDS